MFTRISIQNILKYEPYEQHKLPKKSEGKINLVSTCKRLLFNVHEISIQNILKTGPDEQHNKLN